MASWPLPPIRPRMFTTPLLAVVTPFESAVAGADVDVDAGGAGGGAPERIDPKRQVTRLLACGDRGMCLESRFAARTQMHAGHHTRSKPEMCSRNTALLHSQAPAYGLKRIMSAVGQSIYIVNSWISCIAIPCCSSRAQGHGNEV